MISENGERPEIEYPCEWKYKVIGEELQSILNTIDDTAQGFKYDVIPSNISKKGKYYSINLVVLVNNEEERNSIYNSLNENPNIKIVI